MQQKITQTTSIIRFYQQTLLEIIQNDNLNTCNNNHQKHDKQTNNSA